MVAAGLVGLRAFVQWLLQKPSVSQFHLHHFERLTKDRWGFLTRAALMCEVADGVLSELLKDSRVARTAPALRRCLASDMQGLMNLPMGVWEQVAGLSEESPDLIRTETLLAAHRSCSFMEFRFLKEADGLPWRLCRGQIQDNLRALAGAPQPLEATARKIWQFMHAGHPLPFLERMLQLLADAPWTTTVAEQLHGSCAAVSRHHPEYGVGTLTARACLVTANKLLPGPSGLQKRLQKLFHQLRLLRLKKPARVSARHLYLQDLSTLTDRRRQGVSKATRSRMQQRLVAGHGATFRSQSQQVQGLYRRRTSFLVERKTQELQDKRSDLLHAITVLRQQIEEESSVRRPLTLDSARWTARQLVAFERHWASQASLGLGSKRLVGRGSWPRSPWRRSCWSVWTPS